MIICSAVSLLLERHPRMSIPEQVPYLLCVFSLSTDLALVRFCRVTRSAAGLRGLHVLQTHLHRHSFPEDVQHQEHLAHPSQVRQVHCLHFGVLFRLKSFCGALDGNEIQTHKRLKRTLFTGIKHSLRMFRVIRFIKVQNNT